MQKYIRSILLFLLLFLVHFGFGNSLGNVFSNEELYVINIKFSVSAKLNPEFSNAEFKENHIFPSSFLKVTYCPSGSCCGVYAELIDAWEMLLRNGRTGLKTNVDALTSLNTLLNNSNLISKLPGKTTTEIENLLANMKGWSGASYKQVCDKLNLLVDELPTNVTGLDKYLGSAGFGNGNVYTNRHSWVQLERMLEPANKSYIKSASNIVFENPISSTFGNSVSDIAIFKNGRRIEIETKAGLQFFEGVSGSNFPTQSANSLLNVTDIGDYKVFLNSEKITTLNNADKLNIVNAWKGNSGDFLGNAQIRQLFTDYWNDIPSIDTGLELENLLKNRNDWFDDIFKNNIE